VLTLPQLEKQAKTLAGIVKNYVSGLLQPIAQRLDDLEKAFRAAPKPDVEDIVRQVLEKLTQQQPAITEETLRALIAEEVGKIPTPKDGEPGKSVTVEDITPLIENLVQEKFAQLPIPQDGKSIDPDEVQRTIESLLAAAIEQLPKPKDGEPGKSITVHEIAPLLENLVQEKFAQLPVPQDGKSVDPAEVERMIKTQLASAIENLPKPKDGEPGRDALDIDILPAIPEKSVSRGTYAIHKGGLWRSYQTTDGMRGWECILDGIADTEINVIDDRNYQLRLVKSSGAVTEKTFALRHAIHRGVFKAGDYQPGDTVTWGGSLWHCDEPTSDKPGEPGSKGWTLAVKRGRDGKDGRNGKDFTQPVKVNSGEQ